MAAARVTETMEINYAWSDPFNERNIYINFNLKLLASFSKNSISTQIKDILPWNISDTIKKFSWE